MKKLIIFNCTVLMTLVLSSFFLSPVKAQGYYSSRSSLDRPISMGIAFSPNISWLRYGDEDGYNGKAQLGFSYGLISDMGFSENYYFSTGLMINTLYSDADASLDGKPAHFKYRLQYAEIPLAVKLKSSENYNRSFYGKFGFTLGAKLSGKERIDNADRRTKIPNANVFRMALLIGGGVEWNLDYNMRLITGLSFNNGFTRTMKAGDPKKFICFI